MEEDVEAVEGLRQEQVDTRIFCDVLPWTKDDIKVATMERKLLEVESESLLC